MVKGRPWDIEEERQLRQLVEEGQSVDEISRQMVKTQDAIKKMFDLKLKEKRVGGSRKAVFSSSKLELPAVLPTVEETLQILAAALRKGTEAGLDKDEVQRLQLLQTCPDLHGIITPCQKLKGEISNFWKLSKTRLWSALFDDFSQLRLEAVASHHPDPLCFSAKFIYFDDNHSFGTSRFRTISAFCRAHNICEPRKNLLFNLERRNLNLVAATLF